MRYLIALLVMGFLGGCATYQEPNYAQMRDNAINYCEATIPPAMKQPAPNTLYTPEDAARGECLSQELDASDGKPFEDCMKRELREMDAMADLRERRKSEVDKCMVAVYNRQIDAHNAYQSQRRAATAMYWSQGLNNVSQSYYNASQYQPSPGGNYLGNLSSNPYAPNSSSNPYGYGSPYDPNSINNSYGEYGSRYSNKSPNNPHATDTPKLYDSQGNYRGKLSTNPYDPDSTSNPYGRYGSPYSPDSLNNPNGAGNPYSPDSPSNPYGQGLEIYDE